MKPSINLVGIIFIIAGILTLTYQTFTYTKQEEVAKIGDVKITAETQKSVRLPPILGGLFLATGIVLVIVGRR